MTEPYFFDRLHPKYKCCCGLFHVETGTKLICGLALLGYIISAIIYFYHGPGALWGDWELARIIIGSLMVAGPLVGIAHSKPQYFLPFLSYLGIMLIIGVIQIPLCIVAFFENSSLGQTLRQWIKRAFVDKVHSAEDIDGIITHLLLWFIISLLINIWFFLVIYKCHKYIKDKIAAGYNELTIPQLNVIR